MSQKKTDRSRVTRISRLAALLVVTAFALAVMWASGTRRIDDGSESGPVEPVVAPAAPVAARTLAAETIEIHGVYAGMIRPFERYSIGFEVPGRVETLGQRREPLRDAEGRRTQELDVGDRVSQRQVLAVLDQRVLKARVDETAARLEQAQQELARARRLRSSGQVISATELQTRITNVAIAEAEVTTAQKNLEDATLRAPCKGVISRRMINAGESIQPHQPAFEIVQVDRVLLTVGVPESRVHELETRRRQLTASGGSITNFKTHVQLMGRDRYGKAWPDRLGYVYQIAETADDRTGLFEVEVLVDNTDGLLKPGQVAQARIVIDELEAFRIPLDAVLFRGADPYFYAIHPTQNDLNVLFWEMGPAADLVAHPVPVKSYVEQDGELIVTDVAPEDRRIVVRGQHRLVEGRRVRIANPNDDTGADETSAMEAAETAQSPNSIPAARTAAPEPDAEDPPPATSSSRVVAPTVKVTAAHRHRQDRDQGAASS